MVDTKKVTFERALARTLKFEGGYVNDPADSGGETNYGITIKTARAAGYDGPMIDIPLSAVRRIYYERYWTVCELDEIALTAPGLAIEMFDAAVHCGPYKAAGWLMTAAICVGLPTIVPSECSPGDLVGAPPETIELMIEVYRTLRAARYVKLAETSKIYHRYLRGWLNRTRGG